MISDPISSLLVQKIEEKMGIFKNSGYFLWGVVYGGFSTDSLG
jgi:hypothetical protein